MQSYTFSLCKQCRLAFSRQFHSSLPTARSIKGQKVREKTLPNLSVRQTFSSPSPSFQKNPRSSIQGLKTSKVTPLITPTQKQIRSLVHRQLRYWAAAPKTLRRLTSLSLEEDEAKAILDAFVAYTDKQLSGTETSTAKPDEDPWDVLHLWTGQEADKPEMVNRALTTQLFIFVAQPDLDIQGVRPESWTILRRTSEALDLRFPAEAFPLARARTRKIYLHVGPTNSGKTYNALRALATARSGVYAGPLRLLAHEVWERLNRGSIRPYDADPSTASQYARECNLVTGEEQRIVSPEASLTSCTVEMINLFKHWSVCVIDEIQMIADSQRGYSWTAAVLGVCADEVHLCGEEAAVPLIETLMKETGDELIIKRYQRLTPLAVAEKSLNSQWKGIEKGDCVVTFSRRTIFQLKRLIEQETGLRCAVAYGRLPPEIRSEQAALFNDRESGYDVIVATDAIGMGLNLKIKRVVFIQLSKHNGTREVPLSLSQIKQIGGRAGRFGEHGDASSTGVVTCFHQSDLSMLKTAFESEAPELPKAIVPFHLTTLANIAQLLPDGYSFHELIQLLSVAARLGSSYSLPSHMAVWHGIESIDYYGRDLRLVEKMQFAVSPTTWRSEMEVGVFEHYLRQYTSGRVVDLHECLEESELLATLERVNEARKEYQIRNPSGLPEAASGDQYQNTLTLSTLETLHKVLINYIWLAYRMPVSFAQQSIAVRLKEEAEAGIEYLLERIGERRLDREFKTVSQIRAENPEGKIQYSPREKGFPMRLRPSRVGNAN
ncbi:P-loop containing nucleoside triphosphate hydrolase protein [Ramaria rubella]|nr:P-loop containing nucleoside triphosphate hydrolase protein [Ramaria rubella]